MKKEYKNYAINSSTEFQITAKELGLTITDQQIDLINEYYQYLKQINQTMNLTRLISSEDFWTFHVLDSLFVGLLMESKLNESYTYKYLDIGSGCGVPGIIISILFPQIKCTLCESITKKATFLQQCKEQLNLDNVNIINKRAEALYDDKVFYNFITARAVAPTLKILRLIKPLLHSSKRRNPNHILDKKQSLLSQFFLQTTADEQNNISSLSLGIQNTVNYELNSKPRYITVVK